MTKDSKRPENEMIYAEDEGHETVEEILRRQAERYGISITKYAYLVLDGRMMDGDEELEYFESVLNDAQMAVIGLVEAVETVVIPLLTASGERELGLQYLERAWELERKTNELVDQIGFEE